MLPGVLIAFLLSGVKNPAVMILGAAISGWMSIWVVDYITQQSKIKGDSALAIVLSSFFGLGIVLLTMIQSRYVGNQSGLDHYIFGNAAAMTPADSIAFASVSLVVLGLIIASYWSVKAIIFNSDYAQSIGISRKKIDTLISIITILTISVGIKAVGIVMMSALLIIPPTAARFWTDRLVPMLIISGVFGSLGGWIGAFVSYSQTNMPTGPWTIVSVSIIASFRCCSHRARVLFISGGINCCFAEELTKKTFLRPRFKMKCAVKASCLLVNLLINDSFLNQTFGTEQLAA
jgi:manganese/zinc/iron transport system permease protein